MIQKSLVKYPPIKSSLKSISERSFVFSVEPLLPGFGHTIGNSLRRMLLSTVPGFGVTRVKINEITHEYQAIDGVVEDVMNILLNLKQLRARILTDDDKITLKLLKKKSGEITAADFDTKKLVEIVNPELYICYLSKDTTFEIEVDITRGVGYLPAEKIDFAGNLNPQDLLVDTVFTPVKNVALNVEKVRVGERTDYDKLEISFETDGSVSGEDVVNFTLDFSADIFAQIKSSFGVIETEVEPAKKLAKKVTEKSDIDLPDGILLILEKNGIESKEMLKAKEAELEEFSGLTKKYLKTIKDYINTLS